ncbi:MAG: hypothetical protein P4L33_12750 [Capsulimonadaceae bacterium]|nr:hypothetical protein [Capsulimonadaceae bacterium]
MRIVHALTLILALAAMGALAGCGAASNAVADLLSFHGTYTGSFVHSGITSNATITATGKGAFHGSITSFPTTGDTATFTGQAKPSSLTAGTVDMDVSDSDGTTTTSSTAVLTYSYANNVLSCTLTASALPGDIFTFTVQ